MSIDLPCGAAATNLLRAATGIAGLLVIASLVGLVMRLTARTERARSLAADVVARVRAWWWMAGIGLAVLLGGAIATTVLFAILSFLALREFITLAPTRRADHHTLFWAFFVLIPMQYVLVGIGWYGMFAIFIPVWCFIFVAIRSTLTGDATNYLERAAKVQWGLMLCVYCLSHLPALLMLGIPGFSGRQAELILWLLLVVQLSDVLQYVWGKALGRHKVAGTTGISVGMFRLNPIFSHERYADLHSSPASEASLVHQSHRPEREGRRGACIHLPSS